MESHCLQFGAEAEIASKTVSTRGRPAKCLREIGFMCDQFGRCNVKSVDQQ